MIKISLQIMAFGRHKYKWILLQSIKIRRRKIENTAIGIRPAIHGVSIYFFYQLKQHFPLSFTYNSLTSLYFPQITVSTADFLLF
jgi:hypothetical protein